jgi:hypothetical protein
MRVGFAHGPGPETCERGPAVCMREEKMMRIHRIAVLATVALSLLASCGSPGQSADEPAAPPDPPGAEAGVQPAPEPATEGASPAPADGQSASSPLGGLKRVPEPPPLNPPSNELLFVPPEAEPRLAPAWPAAARARSRSADSAAADALAKDSARA